MALLIQARHLFYGISMLDKFKGTGWKKFFLIFGMCDETFSVNYTAKIPEGVDKGWFYALGYIFKSVLLGFRSHNWRSDRFPFKIRHLRDQLCHDRHVCRNFS